MVRHRKHYTPDEKVFIIGRHLIEKVPVSDLCQEQKLQPTVFYRWLKEFFENGAVAFRRESDSVVGGFGQQVLPLDQPVWESERAQWLDSPRFLVGRLGHKAQGKKIQETGVRKQEQGQRFKDQGSSIKEWSDQGNVA